ncbi:MAG: preprotein translocase subunit SecA [Candidatus Omnitrophota bacterium]
MFDFLIRGFAVKRAQRYIDRLEPAVNLHVPQHLPLPSVGTLKRMASTAAEINGMEERIASLTDEQLKAKTEEFRRRYQEAVREQQVALKQAEEAYEDSESNADRENIMLRIERAEENMKKAKQGALSAILPEAFAVVREAGKRILGMRHYDIQLVGGMVLHEGSIAEMATGEGKTLVATLPVYLNALTGEGVHVVTVNDYLAERDQEWMGRIYRFLGLSVGVILHAMTPPERQEAYGCDITYGTNNEFGFDYLRDNMVSFKDDMVQRPHHFAVIDEVDSILIDEARTPLIISGPAEASTGTYFQANEIARTLRGVYISESDEIDAKARGEELSDLSKGYDYVADEKSKSISLTDEGEERVAQAFGIENLHDMATVEYRHHILQALKAREFFKRDVDYVVREGQVIIVDEFTGRMMPGRRWSDGLHQAVEAKEGIKIERENQTLATITFQNYFRMYEKLSGMTGTAYTEAGEFKQIYELETVVLPTNKPLQRANLNDLIYMTIQEKYQAVVEDIAECYEQGRPVLVGTVSIEKSEILSELLKQRGIPHQVLNAKYHEREAQIVAQAGRYRAITIATNMAGRGTDIVLGGNAEFMANSLAEERRGEEDSDQAHAGRVEQFLSDFQKQVKKEHEQVVQAGGLHVIGTERHESRRIDNQLRGRSGRQGDPGSSRFYVALEDDLMRLFGMDRLRNMMNSLGAEAGEAIEHPLVSRSLEIAQKRVETFNFEIRKQLIEYDNVMNKQREAVYGLRRSILESRNVKDRTLEIVEDVADRMVEQYLYGGSAEAEWDFDGLLTAFKNRFHLDLSADRDSWQEKGYDEIRDAVRARMLQFYEHREKENTPENMRRLEKMLLLNTIDAKWKDHLYAMDQLKGGVGLRAYGQRDPLIEYKREGFQMFEEMFVRIYEEVAEMIFKIQAVPSGAERPRGVFSSLPQNLVHKDFSTVDSVQKQARQQGQPPAQSTHPGQSARQAQDPDVPHGEVPKPAPVRRDGDKVGRNDPCPCGSGKKYKKCCGR